MLHGAPADYLVVLQKPNKARLELPGKTVVADGTTITTLNKLSMEYSQRPQTIEELKSLYEDWKVSRQKPAKKTTV